MVFVELYMHLVDLLIKIKDGITDFLLFFRQDHGRLTSDRNFLDRLTTKWHRSVISYKATLAYYKKENPHKTKVRVALAVEQVYYLVSIQKWPFFIPLSAGRQSAELFVPATSCGARNSLISLNLQKIIHF